MSQATNILQMFNFKRSNNERLVSICFTGDILGRISTVTYKHNDGKHIYDNLSQF